MRSHRSAPLLWAFGLALLIGFALVTLTARAQSLPAAPSLTAREAYAFRNVVQDGDIQVLYRYSLPEVNWATYTADGALAVLIESGTEAIDSPPSVGEAMGGFYLAPGHSYTWGATPTLDLLANPALFSTTSSSTISITEVPITATEPVVTPAATLFDDQVALAVTGVIISTINSEFGAMKFEPTTTGTLETATFNFGRRTGSAVTVTFDLREFSSNTTPAAGDLICTASQSTSSWSTSDWATVTVDFSASSCTEISVGTKYFLVVTDDSSASGDYARLAGRTTGAVDGVYDSSVPGFTSGESVSSVLNDADVSTSTPLEDASVSAQDVMCGYIQTLLANIEDQVDSDDFDNLDLFNGTHVTLAGTNVTLAAFPTALDALPNCFVVGVESAQAFAGGDEGLLTATSASVGASAQWARFTAMAADYGFSDPYMASGLLGLGFVGVIFVVFSLFSGSFMYGSVVGGYAFITAAMMAPFFLLKAAFITAALLAMGAGAFLFGRVPR